MGTLQDALWQGAALQQLCIRQQCQWARQITEALIHIKTDGAAFYTGLRPNNIVLQKGAHGSMPRLKAGLLSVRLFELPRERIGAQAALEALQVAGRARP